MTQEEIQALIDEGKDITLTALGIEMSKGALSLKQYINKQLHAGVDSEALRVTLIRDLKEGGPIFNQLRGAMKRQIAWGVEKSEDNALTIEQGLQDDTPCEWLAIADTNTCDDCLERANSGVHPYSYWVSIGLPGSGNTICGDYCRCDIVRAGAFTDNAKLNAQTTYYQEKYNADHKKQISFLDAQKAVKGIV